VNEKTKIFEVEYKWLDEENEVLIVKLKLLPEFQNQVELSWNTIWFPRGFHPMWHYNTLISIEDIKQTRNIKTALNPKISNQYVALPV
jgi:hypothetical protein